jgi:hypothetical protein
MTDKIEEVDIFGSGINLTQFHSGQLMSVGYSQKSKNFMS